jgi:DNA topoisomerase-1
LKKEDDILTIGLDRALELLAQPKRTREGGRGKTKEPLRELGKHPDDGEALNVYDGPYGPYVKHGKVNASLPKERPVEEVTLEEALELLKAKKSTKTTSSRGRKKA